MDVGWHGVQLRLINVYAPCVPSERGRLFAEVAPLLHTSRLVVLGGDFNSSLTGDLGGLVAGLPLMDCYQAAGGTLPGFTWRGPGGRASRLDYLFVSAGVEVQGFTLQPVWLSDHCLVGAQLGVGVRRRGRGPWRLNTSFLEDASFRRVFQHLYEGWRGLRPLYNSAVDWWEGVKARIATFCSGWGRGKARAAQRRVGQWAAELRTLWMAGPALTVEQEGRMRLLKSFLGDFFIGEGRALMRLGGVGSWGPEEGPSKAFYAALRQRQSRTSLDSLRGPAGRVTDLGEVIEVARAFYADLFSERETDPDAAAPFLDCLGPGLPEEARLALEGDITPSEVDETMATLSEGSAPGCDGLPVEFYRDF